ncbi:MBL fold metallo-hydrolase [Carnobacterium maltaromaticum]|uniref:MBL fold metallo-hydrolase n=1 Tax=Carnobacterium maltaromaticum TaxID=2751 RepID=UPI0012FCBC14|nr:MBL fold metallo-hydrolase [Carnobacterium maltaromaticum]
MNTFISYPVGQGFFYSGSIQNFQLVYDCGTEGNVTDLKYLIDFYFEEINKEKTIDMLVVSHFDNDHVNGLPYLLSKCTVKKMYIPYYEIEDLLVLNLILHIYGEKVEEIILIRPFSSNEEGEEFNVNDDRISKELKEKLKYHVNNTPVLLKKEEWEFRFFNVKPERNEKEIEAINDLSAEFNKEMLHSGVNTIPEMIRKDKDAIKKLKEVLDDYFKKLKKLKINTYLTKGDWSNNSSLCLYHAPKEECVEYISKNKPYFFSDKRGSLLTGDISLKGRRRDQFKEWLNQVDAFNKINVFYLPHHGSENNIKPEFIAEINPNYTVSSSGFKNKYRHPHSAITSSCKRREIPHLNCNEFIAIIYQIKQYKILKDS